MNYVWARVFKCGFTNATLKVALLHQLAGRPTSVQIGGGGGLWEFAPPPPP